MVGWKKCKSGVVLNFEPGRKNASLPSLFDFPSLCSFAIFFELPPPFLEVVQFLLILCKTLFLDKIVRVNNQIYKISYLTL